MSVPVPTLLLCVTPMQLRMLMQAEAVQRAHAEVRDAASTAAILSAPRRFERAALFRARCTV